MSSKTILRSFAVLFAGFCLSIPLFGQQDDAPSVAEAARRTRQQKQDAAKPAHVIDNDAIPPSSAASTSTPAPTNATSDANPAKSPDRASPKSEADKTDDDKKKADIEALKQEIADKLAKVNLQQRALTLTQDSFLSNPDHEHDKVGKENLDSMQAGLTQLQAELTELQAKLSTLGAPTDEKTPETPKP